jgi:hypothetical protein
LMILGILKQSMSWDSLFGPTKNHIECTHYVSLSLYIIYYIYKYNSIVPVDIYIAFNSQPAWILLNRSLNLCDIRLAQLRNNYARKLEVGISQGLPVLIENVPEARKINRWLMLVAGRDIWWYLWQNQKGLVDGRQFFLEPQMHPNTETMGTTHGFKWRFSQQNQAIDRSMICCRCWTPCWSPFYKRPSSKLATWSWALDIDVCFSE